MATGGNTLLAPAAIAAEVNSFKAQQRVATLASGADQAQPRPGAFLFFPFLDDSRKFYYL